MPSPSTSRFARYNPILYLGLWGTTGLAVSAASAWAFFAIADAFPEKGAMVRLDLAVTNWLQLHGTERGESIFVAISWLGGPVLIGVIAIAAMAYAYRRDLRRVIAIAIAAGGGSLLDAALKASYHRTRPTFAAEFNPASWSFPSGHAMNSIICYGLLASWVVEAYPPKRVATIIGTIALVVAIGYARIYLGVHYLSDVIAGYAAGLIWLFACVTGYRFAERRSLRA